MSRCPNERQSGQNGSLTYLHRDISQWRERIVNTFLDDERGKTTILFGGLSLMRDSLIAAALRSLGERFVPLPEPGFEAFRTGKAFGNKGQCNPTYFNVGNLVNYLVRLRDEEGIPTERIIREYCYVTAGGCGPCRFGMYITEYRKALRDAGFEGFRIFGFEHTRGIFQSVGETEGFGFSPRFFVTLLRAVMIGDMLALLGYRMRPYEKEKGSVDAALARCRKLVEEAFENRRSLVFALRRCRKTLDAVPLDNTLNKPKVLVIGEFWAALTEGEGNYRLFRFLEEEGAEVMAQPATARLLLNIWEAKYEATKRAGLWKSTMSLLDVSATKFWVFNRLAKIGLLAQWKLYAKAVGLDFYRLPDVDRLARLAEPYYTLDATGGEGHMEVAHFIECAQQGCADLVISVKPFGCMPSSAVSDGIQTLVASKFPQLPFLSVETSGEGAVNFYSRVQMALHRAKG
ncbi:hypothetical protein [Hydrogenimonas urashimensis]|uniref:hypothetical protein n=1 Tax=Hydrogenimonas urashimensis TaxID=2740515 RepID=UPI001915C82F|nr:hypothetical protein [Hydrogenimonas urashimensis]